MYFFKNQRIKLIDKQLAESTSTLLNSNDFYTALKNPKNLEENISHVLQGSRIGKVFILKDAQSKIIYQSFNAGLLKVEIPTQPEWITIETSSENIRVRNILLKGTNNHIFQIGLVLDRTFLDWEIIDARVTYYIAGIVIALFIASVLLTLILLSPLRILINHLKEATSNLINLKDVQPLPSRLSNFSNGFWANSDEFSSLINTIQKLINRINLNYKLTRSWTFQMAHELKTPLAIVKAETEEMVRQNKISIPYSQDVFKEVNQMSDIISQFLDWAEIENSQIQKNLHALSIRQVTKAVTSRIDKLSSNRIVTHFENDFSIFANPIHLDQLITNLITNALKFSPEEKKIEVFIFDQILKIKDFGEGIPPEVYERIGQPFNVGSSDVSNKAGNGLGLAWVHSVAKLYQWELTIISSTTGTEVTIKFPNETLT